MPLKTDDYLFLVGTASDLVETILSSDKLHVDMPAETRLYDNRMGLTCGDFEDERLNVGYNQDGFVTDVWVG